MKLTNLTFIFTILILYSLINITYQAQQTCCLKRDSSGKCTQCDTNHFLDNDGQCQYIIGGCEKYKRNICLSCKPGFLLINNACQSDCGLLCNTNGGSSVPSIPNQIKSNDKNNVVPNKQPSKQTPTPRKDQDHKPTNIDQPGQKHDHQTKKEKKPDQPKKSQKDQPKKTNIQKPSKNPKTEKPQLDCGDNCKKVLIVDPYCSNYQNEKCVRCYSGYSLDKNGRCAISVQIPDNEPNLPNCSKVKNGKCLSCVSRFWNNHGVCTAVDSNCNQFNPDTGKCLKCYSGFYVNQGKCQSKNILCKQTTNGKDCTQCYEGYRLNSDKQCVLSQKNCKTYLNNKCSSCYGGYTLVQNKCVVSKYDEDSTDYNCKSWGSHGNCNQCYSFYNLKNGKCVPSNPNCANINNKGECISCWATYKLEKGKCIATGKSLIDPGCAKWNQKNKCIKCSVGFSLNRVGVCIRVDPNCEIFFDDGHCKQCYPSFKTKQDGYCRHDIDPACHQWYHGKCSECSSGYYFNKNRICTQIGPNCQTYDCKGKCTSCYPNNILVNGRCQLVKIDTLCRKWADDNCCIQCSQGAYFKQGVCVQNDPNCLSQDKNGYCSKCSSGFQVIQNQCVQLQPPVFLYPDPNCNLWKAGKCIKCADRSFFGKSGKCQTVDPNCQTYTSQGKCTSCWTGVLIHGVCDTSQVNNKNCEKYVHNRCKKCSFGYYPNKKGLCIQVSNLCKTWCNQDGDCTSCFDSYTLVDGSCIYTPPPTFNDDFSDDPNCADVDDQGHCNRCLVGYVFNTKSHRCIQADDNCSQYDFDNSCCSKCYRGYSLRNGKCFL